MTGHSLFLVGWTITVAGLLIYLGTALAAMIRVSRQYSRAMRGSVGFAFGAGISAATRRWWLALPVVVGVLLILLSSKL